ncbi:MAG TPA: glycosyltransferase family 2 protein [Castellaniella sp.]|uniref:glycosyltransferase family 2 protein n=1 Tax=Castellaniella sp. TaxID=1955812 RepID=UPI002F190EB7
MTLSVVIITKNEAAHIEACLDSVAFADEIVVLDSGSTDATCELARARGARVEVSDDWPGFGPQKNRALALATGDWILSLDADERVPDDLAQEICRTVSASQANGYRMARLSSFCGRPILHSGWWPDYVLRLFRRGAGQFSDDQVHEHVQVPGKVDTLAAHLLHDPYRSLEHFIDKLNRYSTDGALKAYAKGRRTTVLGPFGHASWTFIRHYLLRRGFLDGWQGLVLAGMAATGSFYRYAKLYWLARSRE